MYVSMRRHTLWRRRRAAIAILGAAALFAALCVLSGASRAEALQARAGSVSTRTLTVAERLPIDSAAAASGAQRLARSASAAVTLDAGAEFTMVGVTCEPPAAEGAVTILIRTSLDGSSWGSWYEGPLEVVADRDGVPQAYMEAMWTGAARYVQVRASAPSARAPLALRGVRLVALDTDCSGLSAARASGAAGEHVAGVPVGLSGVPPARAEVARPALVSRAGWGANESLRSGTPAFAAVKMAFVHHTAGGNTYTAADAPGIVRGIYAYHTTSLGWSDIGYNFLIDRFGTIYEGRYGGVARGVVGAQVYGFNTGSTGVSMIGTYTQDAPAAAAMTALERLLAWKLGLSGLNPTGTASMKYGGLVDDKYKVGQTVSLPVIAGHRDANFTECPGLALYNRLPAVRRGVAALLDDGAITEPKPWKVTLKAPATLVASGSTVAFKGTVKSTSTGLPGKGTVILQRRPAAGGAWTNLRSRTLTSSGAYAVSLRVSRVADWQFRMRMPADALNLAGCSAVVGLRVIEPKPWKVTLKAPATLVASGSTVAFKGTVKSTSTGLPGKGTVILQRRPAAGGAWTNLRSRTLTSSGAYAVSLRVSRVADWQFRMRMPADALNLAGCSAVVGLRVIEPKPWKVTLKAPATLVASGSTVAFKGTVKSTSTGLPGKGTVILQRRPAAGGAWTNLRSRTLTSSGAYAVSLRVSRVADWQFRMRMPADALNLAGCSAVRTLTVR